MDLLSELIKAGLRYLSTEEGARLITQTIMQTARYQTCPKCLRPVNSSSEFCPYCGGRLWRN